MNDNNIAFSFYNARVVLNVKSPNAKNQVYHFWLTFANSNHIHYGKNIFFYLPNLLKYFGIISTQVFMQYTINDFDNPNLRRNVFE